MRACLVAPALLAAAWAGVEARQGGAGGQAPATVFPQVDLAAGPIVLEADGQRLRVVPITGLERPWALAVLPDLDILVTEREGRLRVIRDGVLDPEPLAGLPEINTGAVNSGLMDIVLHPRFEENRLIYFTYSKPMAGNPHTDWSGGPNSGQPLIERDAATVTLARARYDGTNALQDVTDVFVADAWSQGTSAGRIAFSRDGKILLAVGMPTRHMIGTADDAQNPANHAGKVLRLNEDGSAPHDNPFVGRGGYRPEIYALGIRNALGLFVDPRSGQIWETENGPMGGDELNVIEAGRNYGWPVVSYGTDYNGRKLGGLSGTSSEQPWAPGMEEPFAFWMPSPALAGIIVYTGDKCAARLAWELAGVAGTSKNLSGLTPPTLHLRRRVPLELRRDDAGRIPRAGPAASLKPKPGHARSAWVDLRALTRQIPHVQGVQMLKMRLFVVMLSLSLLMAMPAAGEAQEMKGSVTGSFNAASGGDLLGFGADADVRLFGPLYGAGQFNRTGSSEDGVSVSVTSYVGGPRVRTPVGDSVGVYAHALFGAGRGALGLNAVGLDVSVSDVGFVDRYGGGVEFYASPFLVRGGYDYDGLHNLTVGIGMSW